MDTNRRELAERLHEMGDENLLERYALRNFTELAERIALDEMRSRGLNIPQRVARVVDEVYEGDYETIARFPSATEAYVLQGCLRAAGIPTLITDANLIQAYSLVAIALGGVGLRVPVGRMTEAREIIAAFHRGDLALRDEDQPMAPEA